jgi:hypothetical protein
MGFLICFSKRLTAPDCFEHPWLEVVEDNSPSDDTLPSDVQEVTSCSEEVTSSEESDNDNYEDCLEEIADNNVKSYEELLKENNQNLKFNVQENNKELESLSENQNVSDCLNSMENSEQIKECNVSSSTDASVEKDQSTIDINGNDVVVVSRQKRESLAQCFGLTPLSSITEEKLECLDAKPMLTPHSSPIGCRRTFIPSPETIQETEPTKKHHCRRRSDEFTDILKSNAMRVAKSGLLESSIENTDCSAIITKRGNIIIKKTPIKTVQETKTLVKFYEQLFQHST